MSDDKKQGAAEQKNAAPTPTSRELTIEEALRLIHDKSPTPAGWRLRTAEEILRPYQDPETWAGMLADITDPELRADLTRWVDTMRKDATEKTVKRKRWVP